jgi:type I restriction enzyme M protein
MGAATNQRRASLGFEKELWEAADLLRGNMDPSEYKHVVLGLLFLKYISDAFEERREELREAVADPESDYHVEDPARREEELEILLGDRDEYTLAHVFWVPDEARWEHLRAQAKQETIGKLLDAAMDAIEKENPRLKGVLPKVYARPGLDKDNLGKLIDLFSNLGLGGKEAQRQDVLGRVYEYFLGRFASAEGRGGGEFYTPESVVRVLVEMLEPYKGRVYDPCCGSGGMFVQSVKFVEAHGGQKDQVSIYGQESNYTTWRLAQMNLAIRGIEADLGGKHADTFREDLHPDLRFDYILANPPFNVSEWHGEQLKEDPRWQLGTPPAGNANFAWVQHIAHHLAPGGVAGFVLANGSMSSMSGGEGEIRKRLVQADLVDCMVAMPGQLFYQTQIPVCLWFLAKDRENGRFRDRRGEVLFIDARDLGELETRVHRVFRQEDFRRIADTYHAWRGEKGAGKYEDVPGFCKAASLERIEQHDFVLTPGRYVDVEEVKGEGEPFEDRMERLVKTLEIQLEEGQGLDRRVREGLEHIGFPLSR